MQSFIRNQPNRMNVQAYCIECVFHERYKTYDSYLTAILDENSANCMNVYKLIVSNAW